MRRIICFAEYGFAAISLFISSGAILLLILSGGASQGDVGLQYDTSLFRLSFTSIYLITILLLTCRWKQTLYGLTQGTSVLGFIVLATTSIIWSSAPNSTAIDTVTLIGSSLFGLYLGTRYNLRQLLLILGWVYGVSILLSFLFSIFLPKYGLMTASDGSFWRGIYLHKNGLGGRMADSATVFLILIFGNRRYRWLPQIGIILAIVLILLSGSTSSLINVFLVTSTFFIIQSMVRLNYRLNYRLVVLTLIVFTLATLILVVWVVSNAESFIGLSGKDLTFSGRTVLWAAAWEMIQKKMWFGYGYGGFWHGMNGESSYIWLSTGWKMTHPHNGFISIWLDLGLVGLVLFLIAFIQNIYRSLLLIRLDGSPLALYPILWLLFLLMLNLTETSLPTSGIECSIYVFLTLNLTKEIKKRTIKSELIPVGLNSLGEHKSLYKLLK